MKKPSPATLFLLIYVLFSFLLLSSLSAQELKFGRQAGWKDFTNLSGVGFQKNKEGFLDMTLSAGNYQADDDTELLLHFDSGRLKDEASRYSVSAQESNLTREFYALGDGAAVFRDRTPIILQPSGDALFAPGKVWDDFSLEFWLYPTTGQDGQVLLAWKGARTYLDKPETQVFQASFSGSRLVWTIQNLFAPDTQSPGRTFKLFGRTVLIPRQWHHHLLRYDAKTGLLEYLLDGVTESMLYITPSGTEDGRPLGLVTGKGRGDLILGPRFSGALDELRMTRTWVEVPKKDLYSPAPDPVTGPDGKLMAQKGSAISRVIDLKQPGSTLESLKFRFRQAGDSQAVLYYRMSDRIRYQWTFGGDTQKSLADPDKEEDSWVRVDPKKPLLPSYQGVEKLPAGRYLQLRVDLLPAGSGNESPKIAELQVGYVRNVPPPPPTGVDVVSGSGQLTVKWRPVLQGHVNGYMVFIGNRPGQYLGTPTALGNSPLDVGDVTSVVIDGLLNDQIYYVSVAAYEKIDQGEGLEPIKQISQNSREVGARPQRRLP